ncbi:unnamed protein product, partial [Scytosiphon promiscuus]
MVHVYPKRCSHHTCATRPGFNFEGKMTPMVCKKHAEVGMIDVSNKLCSHDSCTRQARPFSVEGRNMTMYCKQHAEGGMVNVRHDIGSRDTGTDISYASGEGSKTAALHKRHAEDSTVEVRGNLCSHSSCTSDASWRLLANGAGTTCALH